MTLSQLFYSSRIRLKTRCSKEEVTKKGVRPQKEVTLHATSQSSPCTPGSRQYVGLDKVADECGKQSRKVYTFNEDEVVGLIKQWRMDEADNNSDTEDEEEEKPDASASSSKSSLKRDNVLTEEVVDIINKLRTDEKFKYVRYKESDNDSGAVIKKMKELAEIFETTSRLEGLPRTSKWFKGRREIKEWTKDTDNFIVFGRKIISLAEQSEILRNGICERPACKGAISPNVHYHEPFFGRRSEPTTPLSKILQLSKLLLFDFDAICPSRFIFKSDYNFTIITCLENHIKINATQSTHVDYKSDITHPDETYGPSQLYLGFYQPSPGVFFYEYNEPDEMIDLIIMVLVVNDDNYTPDQPVQAIIDITAFD
ncbi:hypothetical protein RhiirC2_845429 [Rhizophagus irregularis]|uniref:Uncharacterized protein n=1 Tax=Rhizophagus irregularis TaxID=588596 RepID=A0A2N1NQI8_9GLOM|nr:hypothetical protein RhiirC2_845429 [Rhizophagus irregularis]